MNRFIVISMWVVMAASVFAGGPDPKAPGKNDYSKLTGIWTDLQSNDMYAVALKFNKDGTCWRFQYYDKDEKFSTEPKTTVWSGHGRFSIQYDVLVMKIEFTSDNMPAASYSYHFVKFTDAEIILLDTSNGKRTTYRRMK